MPEKGWKQVTIREETKRLLKQVTKDKGVTINDFILLSISQLGK